MRIQDSKRLDSLLLARPLCGVAPEGLHFHPGDAKKTASLTWFKQFMTLCTNIQDMRQLSDGVNSVTINRKQKFTRSHS
jgi:hypothetical protein